MSKIKIGAQVTAKVRPTKVTVSGTFQGYRLEDQEDPTSICGTVLHVKDGMQHLDYVYVDSIKVCESEDERIRRMLVEQMERWKKCAEDNNVEQDVKDASAALAYLEKQKEQKTVQSDTEEQYVRTLESLISDFLYGKQEVDRDYYQQICDWLEERHIEQKPAEWSEEDELMREAILNTLERVGDYGTIGMQKDWLKSLRPQPNNSYNGEELQKSIDTIFGAIDKAKGEIRKGDYGSALDSLCIQYPGIPININPYWKPSEAQMKDLDLASRMNGLTCPNLKSLYNDLKKL